MEANIRDIPDESGECFEGIGNAARGCRKPKPPLEIGRVAIVGGNCEGVCWEGFNREGASHEGADYRGECFSSCTSHHWGGVTHRY
eukprot:scaffold11485_cov152-Skeletonema_marinoi.AAC.12